MKKFIPQHPVRKLLRALLPTLFAFQIVMRNTLNHFSYWFLVTYLFVLFLIWGIEDKSYLRYYCLKCVEMLFYFMPISAIIFSFVLTWNIATQGWDNIATAGGIIWGMIGGSIFVFISIVVWLVWWLILRSTNKKPESTRKEGFKWKAWSYGLLILYVILASLIWWGSSIAKIDTLTTDESNTIKTIVDEQSVVDKEGIENNVTNPSDKKEDVVEEKSLIDDVSFKLNDFRTIEWDFSKHFEFDVELSNTSEQDILWLQGYFEVYDMFGDKLWKFTIEEVGAFTVGDSYTDTWKYSMNQFMSEQIKLSKTIYKDLEYKYGVEEIIYKIDWDTENKVQWKNIGQGIENIDFVVLNKNSIDGQYGMNSVSFDISITNNSEQMVKGIKWGFYIYDMFGDKLKWYTVNITDSILSWATYTETLRYDINQFINKEWDVFDTDFTYLKYNFDIEKVLFER